MLDGERREMGIGHQIGTDAVGRQERAQHLLVALGGLGDPYGWAGKPFLNLPPGVRHRFRTLEDARVGHQAQER